MRSGCSDEWSAVFPNRWQTCCSLCINGGLGIINRVARVCFEREGFQNFLDLVMTANGGGQKQSFGRHHTESDWFTCSPSRKGKKAPGTGWNVFEMSTIYAVSVHALTKFNLNAGLEHSRNWGNFELPSIYLLVSHSRTRQKFLA